MAGFLLSLSQHPGGWILGHSGHMWEFIMAGFLLSQHTGEWILGHSGHTWHSVVVCS